MPGEVLERALSGMRVPIMHGTVQTSGQRKAQEGENCHLTGRRDRVNTDATQSSWKSKSVRGGEEKAKAFAAIRRAIRGPLVESRLTHHIAEASRFIAVSNEVCPSRYGLQYKSSKA